MIKYVDDTRKKSLFFNIESSSLVIDLEGLIWSFEASHEMECVFVNFFLFLNLLLDLYFGLLGALVFTHVVEIGGPDGGVQHGLEKSV